MLAGLIGPTPPSNRSVQDVERDSLRWASFHSTQWLPQRGPVLGGGSGVIPRGFTSSGLKSTRHPSLVWSRLRQWRGDFGIKESHLWRHRTNCMARTLATAEQTAEVAGGSDL